MSQSVNCIFYRDVLKEVVNELDFLKNGEMSKKSPGYRRGISDALELLDEILIEKDLYQDFNLETLKEV